MGISYEDLKATGIKIILEKHEEEVIEQNSNNLIRRRKRFVREKYPGSKNLSHKREDLHKGNNSTAHRENHRESNSGKYCKERRRKNLKITAHRGNHKESNQGKNCKERRRENLNIAAHRENPRERKNSKTLTHKENPRERQSNKYSKRRAKEKSNIASESSSSFIKYQNSEGRESNHKLRELRKNTIAIKESNRKEARLNYFLDTLIPDKKKTQYLAKKFNASSRHLLHLEQAFDYEISKLKRQQSLLKMDLVNEILEKKSSTTWDERLKVKRPEMPTLEKDVDDKQEEVTVKHYSRAHKCVCASPIYATNKDFAMRPKTRTIASQMTDRGALGDHNSENMLGKDRGKNGKNIESLGSSCMKPENQEIAVNCCYGCPNCEGFRRCGRCHSDWRYPKTKVCEQPLFEASGFTSCHGHRFSREASGNSQYSYSQRHYASYSRYEEKPRENNEPNYARHTTDLDTQHFYHRKAERSPEKSSPKLQTPRKKIPEFWKMNANSQKLSEEYALDSNIMYKDNKRSKEKAEKFKEQKPYIKRKYEESNRGKEYKLYINREYKEKKQLGEENANKAQHVFGASMLRKNREYGDILSIQENDNKTKESSKDCELFKRRECEEKRKRAPSKENNKKVKESSEDYMLIKKREYEEKRTKSPNKENIKKTNESSEENIQGRERECNDQTPERKKKSSHKRGKTLMASLENKSLSKLVQLLDRYTDDMDKHLKKFAKNSESEQQSLRGTCKVQSQKKVYEISLRKSQPKANCDSAEYYNSAELVKEPQYSLETLYMMKNMKITEYKPIKPRAKDNTIKSSMEMQANDSLNQTLKSNETPEKLQKYQEYVKQYRRGTNLGKEESKESQGDSQRTYTRDRGEIYEEQRCELGPLPRNDWKEIEKIRNERTNGSGKDHIKDQAEDGDGKYGTQGSAGREYARVFSKDQKESGERSCRTEGSEEGSYQSGHNKDKQAVRETNYRTQIEDPLQRANRAENVERTFKTQEPKEYENLKDNSTDQSENIERKCTNQGPGEDLKHQIENVDGMRRTQGPGEDKYQRVLNKDPPKNVERKYIIQKFEEDEYLIDNNADQQENIEGKFRTQGPAEYKYQRVLNKDPSENDEIISKSQIYRKEEYQTSPKRNQQETVDITYRTQRSREGEYQREINKDQAENGNCNYRTLSSGEEYRSYLDENGDRKYRAQRSVENECQREIKRDNSENAERKYKTQRSGEDAYQRYLSIDQQAAADIKFRTQRSGEGEYQRSPRNDQQESADIKYISRRSEEGEHQKEISYDQTKNVERKFRTQRSAEHEYHKKDQQEPTDTKYRNERSGNEEYQRSLSIDQHATADIKYRTQRSGEDEYQKETIEDWAENPKGRYRTQRSAEHEYQRSLRNDQEEATGIKYRSHTSEEDKYQRFSGKDQPETADIKCTTQKSAEDEYRRSPRKDQQATADIKCRTQKTGEDEYQSEIIEDRTENAKERYRSQRCAENEYQRYLRKHQQEPADRTQRTRGKDQQATADIKCRTQQSGEEYRSYLAENGDRKYKTLRSGDGEYQRSLSIDQQATADMKSRTQRSEENEYQRAPRKDQQATADLKCRTHRSEQDEYHRFPRNGEQETADIKYRTQKSGEEYRCYLAENGDRKYRTLSSGDGEYQRSLSKDPQATADTMYKTHRSVEDEYQRYLGKDNITYRTQRSGEEDEYQRAIDKAQSENAVRKYGTQRSGKNEYQKRQNTTDIKCSSQRSGKVDYHSQDLGEEFDGSHDKIGLVEQFKNESDVLEPNKDRSIGEEYDYSTTSKYMINKPEETCKNYKGQHQKLQKIKYFKENADNPKYSQELRDLKKESENEDISNNRKYSQDLKDLKNESENEDISNNRKYSQELKDLKLVDEDNSNNRKYSQELADLKMVDEYSGKDNYHRQMLDVAKNEELLRQYKGQEQSPLTMDFKDNSHNWKNSRYAGAVEGSYPPTISQNKHKKDMSITSEDEKAKCNTKNIEIETANPSSDYSPREYALRNGENLDRNQTKRFLATISHQWRNSRNADTGEDSYHSKRSQNTKQEEGGRPPNHRRDMLNMKNVENETAYQSADYSPREYALRNGENLERNQIKRATVTKIRDSRNADTAEGSYHTNLSKNPEKETWSRPPNHHGEMLHIKNIEKETAYQNADYSARGYTLQNGENLKRNSTKIVTTPKPGIYNSDQHPRNADTGEGSNHLNIFLKRKREEMSIKYEDESAKFYMKNIEKQTAYQSADSSAREYGLKNGEYLERNQTKGISTTTIDSYRLIPKEGIQASLSREGLNNNCRTSKGLEDEGTAVEASKKGKDIFQGELRGSNYLKEEGKIIGNEENVSNRQLAIGAEFDLLKDRIINAEERSGINKTIILRKISAATEDPKRLNSKERTRESRILATTSAVIEDFQWLGSEDKMGESKDVVEEKCAVNKTRILPKMPAITEDHKRLRSKERTRILATTSAVIEDFPWLNGSKDNSHCLQSEERLGQSENQKHHFQNSIEITDEATNGQQRFRSAVIDDFENERMMNANYQQCRFAVLDDFQDEKVENEAFRHELSIRRPILKPYTVDDEHLPKTSEPKEAISSPGILASFVDLTRSEITEKEPKTFVKNLQSESYEESKLFETLEKERQSFLENPNSESYEEFKLVMDQQINLENSDKYENKTSAQHMFKFEKYHSLKTNTSPSGSGNKIKDSITEIEQNEDTLAGKEILFEDHNKYAKDQQNLMCRSQVVNSNQTKVENESYKFENQIGKLHSQQVLTDLNSFLNQPVEEKESQVILDINQQPSNSEPSEEFKLAMYSYQELNQLSDQDFGRTGVTPAANNSAALVINDSISRDPQSLPKPMGLYTTKSSYQNLDAGPENLLKNTRTNFLPQYSDSVGSVLVKEKSLTSPWSEGVNLTLPSILPADLLESYSAKGSDVGPTINKSIDRDASGKPYAESTTSDVIEQSYTAKGSDVSSIINQKIDKESSSIYNTNPTMASDAVRKKELVASKQKKMNEQLENILSGDPKRSNVNVKELLSPTMKETIQNKKTTSRKSQTELTTSNDDKEKDPQDSMRQEIEANSKLSTDASIHIAARTMAVGPTTKDNIADETSRKLHTDPTLSKVVTNQDLSSPLEENIEEFESLSKSWSTPQKSRKKVRQYNFNASRSDECLYQNAKQTSNVASTYNEVQRETSSQEVPIAKSKPKSQTHKECHEIVKHLNQCPRECQENLYVLSEENQDDYNEQYKCLLKNSARALYDPTVSTALVPLKGILKQCPQPCYTQMRDDGQVEYPDDEISFHQKLRSTRNWNKATSVIPFESNSNASSSNCLVNHVAELKNPEELDQTCEQNLITVGDEDWRDDVESESNAYHYPGFRQPKQRWQFLPRNPSRHPPAFTHCPCMLETYLNIMKIHYKW